MAGGGGGTEDLNLVPYLDIMVNLIMFMVTVTAYIVQLKQAPIIAPTYGSGGGGDQKPFLTVAIGTTQMQILGGSSGGNGAGGAETIKKGDWAKLNSRLKQLKDTVPNLADNLVVSADRAVPYKEVIKAMDAVRLDVSGQPLFPNVTLATVVNK